MVTLIKYGALSGGEKYNVNVLNLNGLSTDTKPIRIFIEYGSDGREVGRTGIPNGSLYTEIDTGDTYMYDADNATWYKVSISGGGGGGEFVPTTEQLEAMNSGITEAYVEQIDENTEALEGKANRTEIPTTAADVNALPDTTKYGASISLTIDPTTFVVSVMLKDQDGNTLGTAQTIDLPLESVVVGGSYNDTTKKVVLTLQSGSTVEFSVADLVAGLQSEITSTNKLDADLVDDSTSTNKFATQAQLDQIGTNQNNISTLNANKIGASDYASQNTGGTVRVWTTTDGTDTVLHISNEAPTP